MTDKTRRRTTLHLTTSISPPHTVAREVRTITSERWSFDRNNPDERAEYLIGKNGPVEARHIAVARIERHRKDGDGEQSRMSVRFWEAVLAAIDKRCKMRPRGA